MSIPKEQLEPKVGIITALNVEYVAMKTLLKSGKRYIAKTGKRSQEYVLGDVISNQHGKHRVVLVLAGKGTNAAALRAQRMIQNFPNVHHIIMTGIAGGCPNPKKADEHVRLGDIVVSGEFGVIQYDFKVETSVGWEPRHLPRPPSPDLVDAVHLLDSGVLEKKYPWINSIKLGLKKRKWRRPPARTDNDMEHPKDEKRRPGIPRVFIAPIACANTLVKSPELRDKLRDLYKVKAVEMETSGIADAAWENNIDYLAVRGICDYCDPNKNDVWHQYASMAAAGYTVTLLASMPGDDDIDGFPDSTGDGDDTLSSDKVFNKIPEILSHANEIMRMTERYGPKDRQLMIEFIRNISAFLTHVKRLDRSTSSFIKESVVQIERNMNNLSDFLMKSHGSAATNISLGSYLSVLVVALEELRGKVAKKEPNGF